MDTSLQKDQIWLLGRVLAFALTAAKSDGDYLFEAFAAERAGFVNRIGVFAVGLHFGESAFYVLCNLLGAITATNANPNRLLRTDCFTAEGTFFVNGDRFLRGEGIGAEAKNGSNKDRNKFFHNVILSVARAIQCLV